MATCIYVRGVVQHRIALTAVVDSCASHYGIPVLVSGEITPPDPDGMPAGTIVDGTLLDSIHGRVVTAPGQAPEEVCQMLGIPPGDARITPGQYRLMYACGHSIAWAGADITPAFRAELAAQKCDCCTAHDRLEAHGTFTGTALREADEFDGELCIGDLTIDRLEMQPYVCRYSGGSYMIDVEPRCARYRCSVISKYGQAPGKVADKISLLSWDDVRAWAWMMGVWLPEYEGHAPWRPAGAGLNEFFGGVFAAKV